MDDYKQDLFIDQYKLDNELIKQPQLFMKWALDYAEASIKREEARNKLELIKAKVEHEVRSSSDNKKKVTEASISASVIKSPKVQLYKNRYFKSMRDEKVLQEAKSAMKQKQKMLEGLVQLRIQSYYSDPKIRVPEDLMDTVKGRDDLESSRIKKGIGKKIKRKRKR